jgi:hypothetical protein
MCFSEKSAVQRDALFRLVVVVVVDSGEIERAEVDGRVTLRSDVKGAPLVRLSMAKHVALKGIKKKSVV